MEHLTHNQIQPVTLYLMRHGQTDWNLDKRLQGAADVPLNAVGREEARRTAAGMRDIPLDLILTSPLCRAKETAEILRGGRDIPLRVEEGLREMSFGNCEGKTAEECPLIGTFFRDPEGYIPDGGESYQQVNDRCERLIQEVLLPLEGGYRHVLLATHGALAKALLRAMEKRPLSTFWSGPPQPNCSVQVIRLSGGTFTVTARNQLYQEEKTYKTSPLE